MCSLKMNQMKLLGETGLPEAEGPGFLLARQGKAPYFSFSFSFSLGPRQHFLHVRHDVRYHSPNSSSHVHLLRVHGGHGVSVGVMEGEVFI